MKALPVQSGVKSLLSVITDFPLLVQIDFLQLTAMQVDAFAVV
jgi:hypothetical protein